MHKSMSKSLIGRISVWALAAVMIIGLIPLNAAATESYKNTTAITPVVNGETSVGTTAEFAKAAGDSKVSKINLTDNLVFADFQKFCRKTAGDLVIDGGGLYSIRVSKSDWYVCPVDPTCHVSMEFEDGYKTVTFKDIGLSGEAHNGFVYSSDSTNFVFDGVNFDGPGLAITKNCLPKYASTVTIKDSDIFLRKRVPDSKDTLKSNYLFPAEAVEIGYGDIILTGRVSISKLDPNNTDWDHDEIFYFKEKTGNLIVAPDADVNIQSFSKANGSAYWAGLTYIGCSLASINFIVGENANFTFNSEGGIITENYGFCKFIVGANANVNMQVSTPQNPKQKSYNLNLDTGSYFRAGDITVNSGAKVDIIAVNSAINCRDSVVGVDHLVVGEDAIFRAIAPENTVAELVLKIHGKTPSIYLDRPDEVLIYNGNKPYSTKSSTNAIQAAKVGDGNCDEAKADIAFTFIGAGISTWNAIDDKIDLDYDGSIDVWTPDPAKATTWTTNFRARQFTLKGCISKLDSSFNKTTLADPDNNLGLDVNPANNPASAATGIKTFCNKSVVRFNGASAPKIVKTYVHDVIIEGDDVNAYRNLTTELIGNGVDPISFEFFIDKYEYADCVFNENENFSRASAIARVVGTRENLLLSNTELSIEGNVGTLTIYPVNGRYSEPELFFAQRYRNAIHPERIGDPEYWWFGID